MGAAIAALAGVGKRQQEAFVAACQRLQAKVAVGRKIQRLAGDIADGRLRIGSRLALDQSLTAEKIGDARHGGFEARGGLRRGRRLRSRSQHEVDQAMGVVEGRAEHLPARQILEGRRDAARNRHRPGIDRLRRAETGQRRAKGTDEEDRLDEIAARLLDGERRQRRIVERALGHDAIDGEGELGADLLRRQLGDVGVAAPLVGEQRVGVVDGLLAAFDRDVHLRLADHCRARQRGDPAGRDENAIDAARKSAWLAAQRAAKSAGSGASASDASPLMPGPLRPIPGPAAMRSSATTSVVERSG